MSAVITRLRWERIDGDYKTGEPAKGDARILRRTNDLGTVLIPAEVVDRAQLFDLGRTVATPGALEVLARHQVDPSELFARHAQGDWGDLGSDDQDANDDAIRTGARIFSSYNIAGTYIWVITDGEIDGPDLPGGLRPRQASTVLLPDQY